MKKNILVTGGLGFIGSNLVDILVDQQHEVSVIDNHASESAYFEYANDRANYVNDDVINISQWRHKLGDFDLIFHLAANSRIQPSFQNPLNTLRNNVLGTAAVCEYARVNGNSAVVYAGSSSFYAGVMKNPYAFSKWVGEDVCRMYREIYGLKVGIARFFNVYGPRQPKHGEYATVIGIFERQESENQDLTIVGDGEQRRDFTHVDDICDGLIKLGYATINKSTELKDTYNLGTGTNYSINKVADMFIQNTLRSSINKVYLPQRPGEARDTLADISDSISDLRWKLKNNLEEYIKSVM